LLVYGTEALLIWLLGAVAVTIVAYVIYPSADTTTSANEAKANRAAMAVVALWIAAAVLAGLPLTGPTWILVGLGVAFYLLLRFLTDHFDRWLPAGVAIFLMSVTIGAGIQLARTYQTPKVRPGALVLKKEKLGISGVYIADTDQYVYLAKITQRRGGDGTRGVGYTSRVIAIPKADVEELAVGKLRRLRFALVRAETFRKELMKLRATTSSDRPARRGRSRGLGRRRR
jgi:hypothetical protein